MRIRLSLLMIVEAIFFFFKPNPYVGTWMVVGEEMFIHLHPNNRADGDEVGHWWVSGGRMFVQLTSRQISGEVYLVSNLLFHSTLEVREGDRTILRKIA